MSMLPVFHFQGIDYEVINYSVATNRDRDPQGMPQSEFYPMRLDLLLRSDSPIDTEIFFDWHLSGKPRFLELKSPNSSHRWSIQQSYLAGFRELVEENETNLSLELISTTEVPVLINQLQIADDKQDDSVIIAEIDGVKIPIFSFEFNSRRYVERDGHMSSKLELIPIRLIMPPNAIFQNWLTESSIGKNLTIIKLDQPNGHEMNRISLQNAYVVGFVETYHQEMEHSLSWLFDISSQMIENGQTSHRRDWFMD